MNYKVHSAGVINKNSPMGRPIGLRTLNFDLLAVTFGGKAFFLDENTGITTKLSPVNLLYVPAGERHIYDPYERRIWQNYWVLFDGDYAKKAFGGLFPKKGVSTLKSVGKLDDYWLHLSSLMLERDRQNNAEYAFCLLHSIFMEIKLLSPQKNMENSSLIIFKIIQSLRDNIRSSEVDFKKIAIKNGFELDTLRKRFKRETGLPIHQYFIRLKINYAKSMLSNLSYSVNEVAHFLGFSDSYYFSRLFKSKIGLSPLHFKNQIKNETYYS